MPARSAAEMIISPSRASTFRPSTVISGKGAAALFDVHEVLVAEHVQRRDEGGGDRRAEHADRRLGGRPAQTGGDVVAHVDEELEVGLAAAACLDAAHDLVEPAAAFAARRALPTRLAV